MERSTCWRSPSVRATRKMHDAGAEVEAVEYHVHGDHHGHQQNQMVSIMPQAASGTGARFRGRQKKKEMASTAYMPMKPISVNSALPAETCGDTPAGRAHQAIDQPGLAADLGRDPTRRVGDIGKRRGQHQQPQHLRARKQTAAPQVERGKRHHGDEDGAQPHHDVIAEIEQRNVVGPAILRKRVEALHLGLPALIGQKTQCARNLQRIVQPVILDVRLSDQGEWRALLRYRTSPSMAASVAG